jgi:hypothetical protein
MRLFVYIYIVLTLSLAISIAHDSLWHAIVMVLASLIGFAGGSGMRASFYVGKTTFGIVVGLVLFAIGGGLALYLIGATSFLGLTFSADNWVFLGVLIGFIATRREDAGYQPTKGIKEVVEERKLEKWQQAINDFGEILENHPLVVLPESRLPLPKDEMKQALKAAWQRVDDPRMKQMIEAGYSELSYFRPDISEPVGLDLKLDLNASREEILESVLSKRNSMGLWDPINEEARLLKRDFDKFKAKAAS